MTAIDCPDHEILAQLLLGKLDASQASPLEQHLLDCEDCGSVSDELIRNDEVTNAIRLGPDVKADEELLVRAIARAKRLCREIETVASQQTQTVSSSANGDDFSLIEHESTLVAEGLEILSPAEMPDEIGRLGGYRVLNVIGRGGMGIVFRGEDVQLKRQVALKVMKPELAARASAKERFLREAQSTAAIEHPNIISIYQVSEDQGVPFIAMPFLQGETLKSLLRRKKRLSQIEIIRIGHQIASGLDKAHERGLIHRDIKPDNIWVEQASDQIKILDFGLARDILQDNGLTQPGIIVGTPSYMAPEQAQGNDVDERCDLFSLGTLLYQLATGRVPFVGANVTATLMAVAHEAPVPIERDSAGISSDLSDLIMCLLSKDREVRPQTAAAVAESLANIERTSIAGNADASDSKMVGSANLAGKPASKVGDDSPPFSRTRLLWMGGFGAAALATIITLVMAQGTVRIEIPEGMEEGVEVRLLDGGREVAVLEKSNDWTVKINGGNYKLELRGGHDEFRIKNNSVRIKRFGKTMVDIELTPNNISANKKPWQGWPAGAPLPAKTPFDEHQAKQYQKAWAKYLNVPFEQKLEISKGVFVSMILIPPGEFLMGTGEARRKALVEQQAKASEIEAEGPQHSVTITRPFWMSRHEITRGQFRAFADATGYETDAVRTGNGGMGHGKNGDWISNVEWNWDNPGIRQTKDSPVVQVSWSDTQKFCNWISTKFPTKTFALPTEAQWEYACRAGSDSDWCQAENEVELIEYAQFAGDTNVSPRVGQKKPNGFGLHDMHGSVWEYCNDWFSPDFSETSSDIDPTGPVKGEFLVRRGGAFHNSPVDLRSACRKKCYTSTRNSNLGFRLAMPFDEATVLARQGVTRPTLQPFSDLLPPDAPPAAVAPFDAVTANQHQRNWASYLGVPVVRTVDLGHDVTLSLTLIPPGEFDMGIDQVAAVNEINDLYLTSDMALDHRLIGKFSNKGTEGVARKCPKHRVRVTRPFWLGTDDLTRQQYERFIDETGYQPHEKGIGSNSGSWQEASEFSEINTDPVVHTCWLDATAFCDWLSMSHGDVDLPSEAQWEFACRAGTTTRWNFVSGLSKSAKDASKSIAYLKNELPPDLVAEPNGFGLSGLHNRVFEWCLDSYQEEFYQVSPLNDPLHNKVMRNHVRRGGPSGSASRGVMTAFFQEDDLCGIRVAMRCDEFDELRPGTGARIDVANNDLGTAPRFSSPIVMPPPTEDPHLLALLGLSEDFEWSEPVRMLEPVNSPHWDSSYSMSPDGLRLYLSSDRPRGEHGSSPLHIIWQVSRESTSSDWTSPISYPQFNQMYSQDIRRDLKEIILQHNGSMSTSRFVGKDWTKPTAIRRSNGSSYSGQNPRYAVNGTRAYFQGAEKNADGSNPRIYRITRESIGSNQWSDPQLVFSEWTQAELCWVSNDASTFLLKIQGRHAVAFRRAADRFTYYLVQGAIDRQLFEDPYLCLESSELISQGTHADLFIRRLESRKTSTEPH